MIDYIVVGFGLAGLAFIEQLESHKNTYIVFENASQQSSRVAGGLYNPVILKRFTAAWNASKQLHTAVSFYKKIEDKFQANFVQELPVLRRFNSVEEQNSWFAACDKPVLNEFLSLDLRRNSNLGLDVPYHFGEVKSTGRILIKEMLETYLKYIDKKKALRNESFNHKDVVVLDHCIEYRGIKAKHIVFCEGFGIKDNVFFNQLPIPGNKGEYIVIRCPELKLKEAIKSSIFIIPMGNDTYKVGATYDNKDKSAKITDAARIQIKEKLAKFLKLPYTVIDQVTGIRPATKDRRPIVGTHTQYSRLHVFNGLGSRGIMIAPTIAPQLYNSIEYNEDIDLEINSKRFVN